MRLPCCVCAGASLFVCVSASRCLCPMYVCVNCLNLYVCLFICTGVCRSLCCLCVLLNTYRRVYTHGLGYTYLDVVCFYVHVCFSPLLQFAVNSVLGDTEQILNTLFIPIIIKVSLMVNNGNWHIIHPCDGALRSCKSK